jgi:hypothetical protein
VSDVYDLAFDVAAALSQKSIGKSESWSGVSPRRQAISSRARRSAGREAQARPPRADGALITAAAGAPVHSTAARLR